MLSFPLSRDKVLVEPGTRNTYFSSIWSSFRHAFGSAYACFLAHWHEHLTSQGELIVYPLSCICRHLSVHNFKRLHLWNRLTNQSKISCGAPLWRENESLYKWSSSYDQGGRHAHKSRSSMILKLGVQHRGLKRFYKIYINDEPWVNLDLFLRQGQIW